MTRPGPNILFIQCDQMGALALPAYGNRVARTPHLDRLAAQGAVFENAYCNFPICAPSRFSMLAGRLASAIGAYDNGAELPASVPTFAHVLRRHGYQTTLSGKMHFVGPDQLHGFEERLTTDVYPADFYWTPCWDADAERYPFERGGGVTGVESLEDSGVCERSLQLDYDEEVVFQARQKLFDLARADDRRPFLLAVSFTHPHDPYVAMPEHWERYRDDEIDTPTVGPIPYESRDAHSQRHFRHIGLDRGEPSAELVRRVRHGYYAAVSYVDDKVGVLLDTLDAAGFAEDTLVVFTSDHGDMLGERGMWFKQTFFEPAMRVPLLLRLPGRIAPGRVSRNASLLDLLPTFADFAGAEAPPPAPGPLGASLAPLLDGGDSDWPDVVYAEHLSDAAYAPRFMIRRGGLKYVSSPSYPAMLHDLDADPHELTDLAGSPGYADVEAELRAEAARIWDGRSLEASIRASQAERRLVQEALSRGRYRPWDHQPMQDASKRFVRFGSGFPEVERRAFLPNPPRRG